MLRLGMLAATLLLGVTAWVSAPAYSQPATASTASTVSAAVSAPAAARKPSWTRLVPAGTTQVVRTVSTHRWCRRAYCTVTQAWAKRDGHWVKLRAFRSTIGKRGWGKRREGDDRSPGGVLRIKITFSTTRHNPGHMWWRRRKATSIVSDAHNHHDYNTWLEVPGVTSGNRPSMRWGWVVDYNHPRLRPGVGPAPVIGKGNGIFYHTSKPGHRWAPTAGCTQVGNPRSMHWLLTWLRPSAHPRLVQNR